ncbi:hypothetical protein [Aeromicrobium sp. NPDC092404]|uniref:hypothetical protein n=1 Tax=Aeromicrobium sp. NPDC092404 TaxID=3154976 RepID=UPI003416781A
MSLLPVTPDWSLLIYRVRDDLHQQKILSAFHRIAWPGMTVLGTQNGAEHFVIVDCDSSALEVRARRIITHIDRDAVRILRSMVPGGDALTS